MVPRETVRFVFPRVLMFPETKSVLILLSESVAIYHYKLITSASQSYEVYHLQVYVSSSKNPVQCLLYT